MVWGGRAAAAWKLRPAGAARVAAGGTLTSTMPSTLPWRSGTEQVPGRLPPPTDGMWRRCAASQPLCAPCQWVARPPSCGQPVLPPVAAAALAGLPGLCKPLACSAAGTAIAASSHRSPASPVPSCRTRTPWIPAAAAAKRLPTTRSAPACLLCAMTGADDERPACSFVLQALGCPAAPRCCAASRRTPPRPGRGAAGASCQQAVAPPSCA